MVPPAGIAASGLTRSGTIAGYAIAEFRQPPDRWLPPHEHAGASLCFVLAGSYTERVGGVDQECAPHAMVFKPAGERHADRFGRLGATCLLVEIPPERLAGIAHFRDLTEKPGLVRNPRLAGFGRSLYRELAAPDALSPLAVEALVLDVLVEAARATGPEPGTSRPAWLARAHELIHDRFGEALTLSSVAREVGVHPSHLARTFRRHYHRSVGGYARQLRIERAARQLAETAGSLAEIGARAGFFDQSHFSKVFKGHTGLTPGQFRNASLGRTSRTEARRSS